MVSGLVTSPCDQLRIFSGVAGWILMASKSAMGPVSSNGLERNIFGVSVCRVWRFLRLAAGYCCFASAGRWMVGHRLLLFMCPSRWPVLLNAEREPRSEELCLGGAVSTNLLPRWLAGSASSGRPV